MSSSIDKIQNHFDSKIFEIIEKYNITSIIDYGCGTGERLHKIRKNSSKDLELFGVDVFGRWEDVDKVLLNGDSIKFIDRDSVDFDMFFSSKKCDLVITTFALHHFRYPVKELKMIESLLAPNGYLFIGDMSICNRPEYVNENISICVGDFLSSMRGVYHRRNYTLEEAQDIIQAIDVNLVESRFYEIEQDEKQLVIDSTNRSKKLENLINRMDLEKYPSKEIFDLHVLVREHMKNLFLRDNRAVAVSSAIVLLAQLSK